MRKGSGHIALAALSLGLLAVASTAATADEFGTFLDELNVQFLTDGKAKLLNDFRYQDPANLLWTAKSGYVTDGATIPQVFWTLVGGPFDGPYIKAAVIHDQYCSSHERTWQDTDRVFYNAMRAAGVSDVKAKTMYYAVLVGGPRWVTVSPNTFGATICLNIDGQSTCHDKPRSDAVVSLTVRPTTLPADVTDVRAVQQRLESGESLSLQQLESLAASKSASRVPAIMQ